ncbi:5'/3'-nucleotidase SurE [Acidaminobacter hydrogenoformans]|uniref:5'-nucleotidase SurE n=1 Tax=Acidaminobacter hydrogenoformans DSM 2784 TaxID=1120920 RepID=A0A1G5RRW6_9FIRM|nr:5'/3'-nucleotidase SurE [Acidaminobacter hydrogenoformans]SCZ76757.1 5'-nucleotidase /3'-nucleotidase /exopolyphosphatase [Acidaminobacter hydrogenoformans DSM 2784]
MNIFISNDDGIQAAGLKALVEALVSHHKVYVAAPEYQQSAKSHALTMHDIVHARRTHLYPGTAAEWAINGTPADCVKIGLAKFEEVQFDVVLSGINNGPNLGIDVIYSGTVAAALEGSFHDIPSFALSHYSGSDSGFTKAAGFIRDNLEALLAAFKWDSNAVNVNFPPADDYNGITYSRLGKMVYQNSVQRRTSPRGGEYYWIAGDLLIPPDQFDTDVYAISQNQISLTPIRFNFNDLQQPVIDSARFKLD